MNVAVFGAGYVGLVTGAVLAEVGHRVALVDTDPEKVSRIAAGHSPIYEPGLESMLQRGLAGQRLWATLWPAAALLAAEVVFIAVGTPPSAGGAPDLTAVRAVARALGTHLSPEHPMVIVNKATVPIGTFRTVAEWINEAYYERHHQLPPTGVFAVVSNPEFLREGQAVADSLYPDRIVLGSGDGWAVERMLALYEPLIHRTFSPPAGLLAATPGATVPVRVVNPLSSELIKYAANAFLSVKISFANEIAQICERVGADVREVMPAMGLDPRIGGRFLEAGIGWGGSCFGKDLNALIATARGQGYAPAILEAAREVNARQRHLAAEWLSAQLGSLAGRRVAVWGLAFKPGTDDVRDAPALAIVRDLLRLGAEVVGYDPVAMPALRRAWPDLPIRYAPAALAALDGADALVIATEWPEFSTALLAQGVARMAQPVVFDGRNAVNPQAQGLQGAVYRGIGRAAPARPSCQWAPEWAEEATL